GEEIVLEDVEFPTFEEKGTEFGSVDFYVAPLEKTVGSVIKESFYQSVNTIKMIWESLFDLIRGRYGIEAVSGPVGAAEALVEAGTKYGFMDFLYLGVVISMNLGVMNLLPLPALDGGRLIFLIIEAIRRKPLKMEVEGYINFGGLVLLLLFSAFIILKDVIGLFS
ncbi:MAG: site-2 protease family protein, partial [Clostridia bacterium]|nr:site-2 protease family protein [Clostridia bacterium]